MMDLQGAKLSVGRCSGVVREDVFLALEDEDGQGQEEQAGGQQHDHRLDRPATAAAERSGNRLRLAGTGSSDLTQWMMVNFWVTPGKYCTTLSQPNTKNRPMRIDFFMKAPAAVNRAL